MKKLITILLALALCGTASAAKKTKTTVAAPEPEKQTAPATIVDALGNLSGNLLAEVSGKPTFAFVALTSDDGNALVENYVTDALTEAMFNTGKIKIVERASIEKIMTEQQFQSSALVNENTAVEIGNLSGADYVCYGTVKDLNGQITLNVRVIEVSTAELSAMSRDTVAKDEYLSNVGFEKRASSSTTTTKKVANNPWKCEKVRNEFDECTVYTFTVTTPDGNRILVGLKKCDNSLYSKAYCGIYDFEVTVEIKEKNDDVTKKRYWNFVETWYLNGNDGERYLCDARDGWKDTKWLFDICLNNDVVTIRGGSKIAKFQTAGLEEKMAEYGLTPQDFYDAYANDEF